MSRLSFPFFCCCIHDLKWILFPLIIFYLLTLRSHLVKRWPKMPVSSREYQNRKIKYDHDDETSLPLECALSRSRTNLTSTKLSLEMSLNSNMKEPSLKCLPPRKAYLSSILHRLHRWPQIFCFLKFEENWILMRISHFTRHWKREANNAIHDHLPIGADL